MFFYEKTKERLHGADGNKLQNKYELSKAKICNQGICFNLPFILVKNITQGIILGTPFLNMIYPFKVDKNGITTTILGKDICLKFILPIQEKDLNILKEISISSVNI